jgi:hypothetical protein
MKLAGGFILKNVFYTILTLLFLFMMASNCSAGENEKDDTIFGWGVAERLRQTTLLNPLDLSEDYDDDMNFIRLRTQLWGEWNPIDGIKFLVKLNNEHRHYFRPDREFEIDEIILENLYVRWDGVGGLPLNVIAGRQNFRYGEGFLYMDGGPEDGSRTAYFNAIRVIIPAKERTLEFHFLSDPSKDNYLPIINNQDRELVESKEIAAGLYYQEKSFAQIQLDGYYFFKEEEGVSYNRPQSRIHTLGSRVVRDICEEVSVTAEAALQLGKWSDKDRLAYGGYCYGTYRPPIRFEPALTLGAIYLSGDDNSTDKYEGWNPLFGRWPKWSELYIYTLLNEGGIAYWDNLFVPHGKLALKLHERLGLESSIYLMYAPESDLCIMADDSVLACPIRLGRTENDRGVLTELRLTWRINNYLTGHLLWEHLEPGGFYSQKYRNPSDFVRWELLYKY